MSGTSLTIVMYHYVRPLRGSKYPFIKGLELKNFIEQLNYLSKKYQIITPQEALEFLQSGTVFPKNSALLTFDDGYKDHYRYVFPLLHERKLSGIFFPITSVISDENILDVNRLHFILASADPIEIIKYLEEMIDASRDELILKDIKLYRDEFFKPNRFDLPPVNYLKRMLQHVLPEDLRMQICKDLFSRYVSPDERVFSNELYVNKAELKEMFEAGMEIGSHGHRHYWLGKLDSASQENDIDASLSYLSEIGVIKKNFWFCYPYGSYNLDTINILEARSCVGALTVSSGVVHPNSFNKLELPRLDTNDIKH
jgi:peptidoglycan/xylan/chitin deacetylase (PgdA/CDA1 family)